jgi:hypothetical protein
MSKTKHRPVWPSDDQVRELEGDQEFTDEGRKVTDADHVGASVPDTDPEHSHRMRPRHRSRR